MVLSEPRDKELFLRNCKIYLFIYDNFYTGASLMLVFLVADSTIQSLTDILASTSDSFNEIEFSSKFLLYNFSE